MKKTKTPVKIIKTPVSIQRDIDLAKQAKIYSSADLARREACVTCCYVGQGCDPLCPHL